MRINEVSQSSEYERNGRMLRHKDVCSAFSATVHDDLRLEAANKTVCLWEMTPRVALGVIYVV